MTTTNGKTGLLSDPSWLTVENQALREELAKERERTRVAERQFREIEDRLHNTEKNNV